MRRVHPFPTIERTLRAGLVVLLLAGCGGVASATDWEDVGPAPLLGQGYWHTGRVSSLACSPTDENLYYVAGADGGVWRTTDGGSTWTPLTDDLPTTAIGALALDPTNESIIYAGSGESNYANHSRYGLGLYKSTDGGDTWEVLAADVFAGRCFAKIRVDPLNPLRLYAAITRAGGFPELAAAKGHPGSTGPLGVFRSDDGGVTWVQLTNGLPNLSATDLALDPNNPDVLFAGIGRIFGAAENGVYRTTDGGDSWTRLSGGLPTAGIGRVSVEVAPSSSNRVYALLTNPSNESGGGASMLGAYRSDDGGDTWTSMPALAPDIQATYGWYLSIIGVDPTDPDVVFMGGVTFHRSINAGAGWNNVTPPHVDMHAIGWDATGRLVVGDDGGVHRSPDNGDSWGTLNDGLSVAQCYAGLSTHPTHLPQHDVRLFVGLQDNGSVRRIPSAPWLWMQGLGGDGGWTQVEPTSGWVVFAEFQGTGNLYKSTDVGTTFVESATGIIEADRNCFMPPYLFDPSDTNRMIYATHRIYVSTNQGDSWSVLSGDLTGGGTAAVRALAMAPAEPSTVYAATNDGRVLVSIDSGEHWELLLEDIPGWPRITRELYVAPDADQTVYLAVAHFGETQIRRSADRGQTWEALDANFPDIPVNVVAVDVRGTMPVIYAGADDGVYRSVNNGATWHRFGGGLANTAVIDLRLEPEEGRARLIAATQGRGIWIIQIGLPADMNGDGTVNAFDIDPFALALTDPDAYAAQYPDIDPLVVGDINGDGLLNAFDIDPFVQVLAAAAAAD